MSPEKTENPTLKKVEKENLRLGKPITRAFLKANHGIIEELKRSLKNEPVSDCCGIEVEKRICYVPLAERIVARRIGDTAKLDKRIEYYCKKCHKPTKPIQPSGEEEK